MKKKENQKDIKSKEVCNVNKIYFISGGEDKWKLVRPSTKKRITRTKTNQPGQDYDKQRAIG